MREFLPSFIPFPILFPGVLMWLSVLSPSPPEKTGSHCYLLGGCLLSLVPPTDYDLLGKFITPCPEYLRVIVTARLYLNPSLPLEEE